MSGTEAPAPPPAPARRALPWVLVCSVALLWSVGHARHNYALHAFEYAGSWSLLDEGSQTLLPLLVARGKIPYYDFEPRHTPLGYYLLAAAWRVLGPDLYSIRLAMALTNVCTALLAFALARRAGAGGWAYLAPLGVLLWGVTENMAPVPRWMAVPMGLGAYLALARHAPRPAHMDVVLAGALCGVTFLTSQNTGVFGLATCVWSVCYWSCGAEPRSATAAPPLWARLTPIAGAAIASFVLARMVWVDALSPAWGMLAGPSLAVVLLLAWIVRAGAVPTARTAKRLLLHLMLLGTACVAPVLVMGGWYMARGGWAPIRASLAANWGGLSTIYTLAPPAPPILALLLLALWLAAAVLVTRPAEDAPGGARRLTIVTVLLALSGALLWGMWLPAAGGQSAVEAFVTLSDRVIIESWLYALWLVGPAVVVVGAADLRSSAALGLTRASATALMAGLAAIAGWTVMFPWADYHHALWATPAAAVAFAVLVRHFAARVHTIGAGLPRWRIRRAWLAAAAGLVPAAFVLATAVKWGTYWFDMDATRDQGRLVRRAWVRLDTARGNILVDAATQQDWAGMLAYVRAHTGSDDPVLGLPYLPLVTVLADRPFPLHDVFWHPDFDNTVRSTQRQTLRRVLESGTVALVVGPITDDTYFSLPTFRENWPEVWDALTTHYERTAVFGKYWVFQRRSDAAEE